jgi:kojibiose phosphorylase/nigerose phosphorylase
MNWMISQDYYEKEEITRDGNKYLTGNGYLGMRGTLQEYEKDQLVAMNLSGIYDQYGDGWREPLNAPNACYTYLEVDHKKYRLPEVEAQSHSQRLDIRHGIFHRETTWSTERGTVSVKAEQFTSMKEFHFVGLIYSVTTSFDGQLTITTGIDGEVWDIHGPHYQRMELEQSELTASAYTTTNEGDHVAVYSNIEMEGTFQVENQKSDRKALSMIHMDAQAGEVYTFYKYITVFTNKDCKEPLVAARNLCEDLITKGYEKVLDDNNAAWEALWEQSEVIIEGDDEAMTALNYSLYHLHCIAPRHTDSLSIAARGLSGHNYKGAVFWDTEMFMLDFFLYTEPEVVKTLLQYRVDTLEGAKKKAKSYGYEGAFYAWESQEGGYDACSDYNVTDVFTGRPMRTFFKDKQVHISSAIVYGISKYIKYTGDTSFYERGAAKVILECAKFYYDLLVKKVNSDRYEIHDVIGPDEYHERVNNNVYTNRMAKQTMEAALEVINKIGDIIPEYVKKLNAEYEFANLRKQLRDAVEHIYIKQPEKESGVIEQFDGYFELEDVEISELKKRILHEKEYWGGAYGIASHTKVIKQADVVTMLNLYAKEYSTEILRKNLNYYEPRTEHGSSLSACMYALLACACGEPERAYPFFVKTANADLIGGGKEWAGLVYIGGTHPAAAGGAYMTAIEGFGGFSVVDGKMVIKPQLPKQWKKLSYGVLLQGKKYRVEVTGSEVEISQR